MKIFKSPEDSGLLRNALLKQLRIIKKEQMVGFHGMSLVTSGVSLFGNILASQDAIANRKSKGNVVRAGKRAARQDGGGVVRGGNGVNSARQGL